MAPIAPRVKLSQSGSLLLDMVRFLAAFAVLLHHFVDLHFSAGWANLGPLGHEAVCVFFVLSGFIIRFITVTRIGDALEYGIDRISRIYSVVLPALLFTVACEATARAVHPATYAFMAEPFTWSQVPAQLLTNLTFLSQCWGYDMTPLSNVAFWSLSFECVYYVLYMLVHYGVRYGYLWVVVILLVAGPNIALLAPVWLLGSWTCDLYLSLSRKHAGEWIAGAIFAAILMVLAAVRHPLIYLIRATGHEARMVWVTDALSGTRYFQNIVVNGQVPWLSQLSVSYFAVGLVTAGVILFGLLTLDRHCPNLPPTMTRWTRLVADSTFALYLFHLPMLMLIAVLVGHPIVGILPSLFTVLGIPLCTIPIAMYLDRMKVWMRNSLRRRFAPRLARAA